VGGFMKRVILMLLLVLWLVTTALADSFQFVNQIGSPIVGAAVYLGKDLIGYTDVQGIVIIANPKGTNRFSVVYRGEEMKVPLNIAGNPQLQEIRIKLDLSGSYPILLQEFIIEEDHVIKINIDNADLYLLVDNIRKKPTRTNIIIFKKNGYIINEGKNDYDLEVARINKLGNNIKDSKVLEGDEVNFTYNDKKYKLKIIKVMIRKMSLFTDHMKVHLFETD
jgi:hypothetical protein